MFPAVISPTKLIRSDLVTSKQYYINNDFVYVIS